MKASLETAEKQARAADQQRRIDRINAMLMETSVLSAQVKAENEKHPAQYALNRAWRALEDARNLLR